MTEDSLAPAIEELYTTFSSYPLREHIEACSHCHDEAAHRLLASKPLRELTTEELRDYAFSAVLTWGDGRDFRHFLPRMFELMVLGDLECDPEIVVGTLGHADWASWPAGEKAAIRRFFDAWWRRALETFPSTIPAGDCLCAIGRAQDDLSALMRIWLESPSPAAWRHLTTFVFDNLHDWTTHRTLANAFWKEHEVPMRQVMELLLDPAFARRLLKEAALHSEEPFAEEMAEASRLLDTLRP